MLYVVDSFVVVRHRNRNVLVYSMTCATRTMWSANTNHGNMSRAVSSVAMSQYILSVSRQTPTCRNVDMTTRAHLTIPHDQ